MVIALGIDYRQLTRFRKITPHIVRYHDGRQRRVIQPGYDPTDEEFQYSRQFVVTVALRLAELDVHAARPGWWTGP